MPGGIKNSYFSHGLIDFPLLGYSDDQTSLHSSDAVPQLSNAPVVAKDPDEHLLFQCLLSKNHNEKKTKEIFLLLKLTNKFEHTQR